jgi:hypothetical protein
MGGDALNAQWCWQKLRDYSVIPRCPSFSQ